MHWDKRPLDDTVCSAIIHLFADDVTNITQSKLHQLQNVRHSLTRGIHSNLLHNVLLCRQIIRQIIRKMSNEREEFMQETQHTQQTATRKTQNQDKKTA